MRISDFSTRRHSYFSRNDWTHTWEASLRLAAHVVASPHVWQKSDACILELGSGAGFLGLVCARLFDTLPHTDAKLYLTDLEGQVLDRLRETAQLSTST